MVYALTLMVVGALSAMLPMRKFSRAQGSADRHGDATRLAPYSPLPAPRNQIADGPILKHLVWAPISAPDVSGSKPRYPTLEAIDRACVSSARSFASDPHAAALEKRARALADESWSELVWLTGLIDQARFDALCAALEHLRSSAGSDVELVVVRELHTPDTSQAR